MRQGKNLVLLLILSIILPVLGCSRETGSGVFSGQAGREGIENNVYRFSKTKTHTLSYVTWRPITQGQKKKLNEFSKKYPGIRVNVVHIPLNQYSVRLKTKLMAGQAEDIIALNGMEQLESIRGYLAPVEELAEKSWGKKWDEGRKYLFTNQSGLHNAHCFGVPINTSLNNVLICNKVLFDANGVYYPKNLRSLSEAAAVFRGRNIVPLTLAARDSSTRLSFFAEIYNDFNMNIKAQDKGKALYDSLQIWDYMFKSQIIYRQDLLKGFNTDVLMDFLDGKASMLYANLGDLYTYHEFYENLFNHIQLKIISFPDVNGDSISNIPKASAYEILSINKSCKNPDAAWKFIKWAADRGNKLDKNSTFVMPVNYGSSKEEKEKYFLNTRYTFDQKALAFDANIYSQGVENKVDDLLKGIVLENIDYKNSIRRLRIK